MKKTYPRRLLHIAICACLLPFNVSVRADQLQTDATWIIVGTAATGAALGIGIFYAVHHTASIRGCVNSSSNGLELRNEGDQQLYLLVGMTNEVKPGNRVRVSGKRKKGAKDAPTQSSFLVEKLAKDYGSCEVAAVK